jgi:hypothetical protein
MKIRSSLKRSRAYVRIALGVVALLAIVAPAASAHTSAVCAVTKQHSRCTGTIVNRPLTHGSAQVRMTVHDGHGAISIQSVAPTPITANLVCAQQPRGLACIGIADVGGRHLLITTLGSPGHGTVLVRISIAVNSPPPLP